MSGVPLFRPSAIFLERWLNMVTDVGRRFYDDGRGVCRAVFFFSGGWHFRARGRRASIGLLRWGVRVGGNQPKPRTKKVWRTHPKSIYSPALPSLFHFFFFFLSFSFSFLSSSLYL